MFLLRHGSDLFHDVADKRREVAAAHLQPQLSCLALAHLKDLGQETFGTLDVVVDDLIFLLVLWSLRSQFEDSGIDDRQRREQFVSDIGQHHAHAQSVLCAQVVAIPANGGEGGRKEENYIYKVCPPRSIPWRQHSDGDAMVHLLPLSVAARSAYTQIVCTRGQVLIDGIMLVACTVFPIVVIAFQHIGVEILLGIAVGEQCEVKTDLFHRCRQRDAVRERRRLFRDALSQCAVSHQSPRFIVDDDVGDDQPVVFLLLL